MVNFSKSLFVIILALSVAFIVASCDKEAAEQKIFNDPVMKASLLDKMMADASMMETMIDHSLADQLLSDQILDKIITDEKLSARILTKALEDSSTTENIIFRIRGNQDLKKRVTARR
ncbi:MAG: hypothetical protein GY855_01250 [candidate division Zixibacteria bacterium]|nr:hypothetical protein [candidate division Zixibacteria bacterium]